MIGRRRGCYTWTLLGIFFAVSAVFFITQIRLSEEIKAMEEIGAAFDLARIPLTGNDLSYSYYDDIAFYDFLFPDAPRREFSPTLLNQDALDAIPEHLTFSCRFIYSLINRYIFYSAP